MDDIKDYQDLTETHVTIDDIFLLPGTKIYATVRAFNKVGLHNVLTSEAIQISLRFDPIIKVLDGTGGKDLDYQNNRHVIQGKSQNIIKPRVIFYDKIRITQVNLILRTSL